MPKISLREEQAPQHRLPPPLPRATAGTSAAAAAGAPRAPQAGLARPHRGTARGPRGPTGTGPQPPARQRRPHGHRLRGAGSPAAAPLRAAAASPRAALPGKGPAHPSVPGARTHTTRREMIQETMAAPGGGSGLGSGGRRLLKGRFLQQAQPRPGHWEGRSRRVGGNGPPRCPSIPRRCGASGASGTSHARPHRGDAPVRARGSGGRGAGVRALAAAQRERGPAGGAAGGKHAQCTSVERPVRGRTEAPGPPRPQPHLPRSRLPAGARAAAVPPPGSGRCRVPRRSPPPQAAGQTTRSRRYRGGFASPGGPGCSSCRGPSARPLPSDTSAESPGGARLRSGGGTGANGDAEAPPSTRTGSIVARRRGTPLRESSSASARVR